MITTNNPTGRADRKSKLEKQFNELPESHPVKATVQEVTTSMQHFLDALSPSFDTVEKSLKSIQELPIFEKLAEMRIQMQLYFEAWRIKEAERHEKNKDLFDDTKEEFRNYLKIVPKDYNQFIKWYDKFIYIHTEILINNIDAYSLFYNSIDEVTPHEHEGTKFKIIGVCSVAFEQYSEYKIKQHKAQKNAEIWSDIQEYERMKNFIIIGKEHPVQVEDHKPTTIEKIIQIFEEKDLYEKSLSDFFFNKNDYKAFIVALALHIEGKEYKKPKAIQLRSRGIKKIAKAIHETTLNTLYKETLSKDYRLFDLIRVLEPFNEKTDKDIAKDLQR